MVFERRVLLKSGRLPKMRGRFRSPDNEAHSIFGFLLGPPLLETPRSILNGSRATGPPYGSGR